MPMSCGQSQSYWARFTSHHHLLITFTSKINTGHWVLPYGGSSWPSSCGILRCISFISESKACWVGSGKKQGEVEWNSKSDASPWWTGSWRSPCNELANWVHDGLENWVHNGLNNVAHNGLGASRRSSRRTIEIDENKGAKGITGPNMAQNRWRLQTSTSMRWMVSTSQVRPQHHLDSRWRWSQRQPRCTTYPWRRTSPRWWSSRTPVEWWHSTRRPSNGPKLQEVVPLLAILPPKLSTLRSASRIAHTDTHTLDLNQPCITSLAIRPSCSSSGSFLM